MSALATSLAELSSVGVPMQTQAQGASARLGPSATYIDELDEWQCDECGALLESEAHDSACRGYVPLSNGPDRAENAHIPLSVASAIPAMRQLCTHCGEPPRCPCKILGVQW